MPYIQEATICEKFTALIISIFSLGLLGPNNGPPLEQPNFSLLNIYTYTYIPLDKIPPRKPIIFIESELND